MTNPSDFSQVLERLDQFGITVLIDGRQYRVAPNADRTVFFANYVRPLEIVSGSEIVEKDGTKYLVEQIEQTYAGCAKMRVRELT